MTYIIYESQNGYRQTAVSPMVCETTPATTRDELTVDDEGNEVTTAVAVPAVTETLSGQALVDWLIERGRLPFSAGTAYRLLDDADYPTGWPVSEWGAAYVADGTLPTGDHVPTLIEDDYTVAIQALVDATARSRQYTDGVSMATYVTSTNTSWAAEATAFVAWRDATWSYAYAQLAAVQSGQRTQPTVDELLTEITPIVWPA